MDLPSLIALARRKIRLIAAAIPALALLYLGFAYYQEHKPGAAGVMHYKMTVEVQTPEGLKSASVVRAVSIQVLSPAQRAHSVKSYVAKVRGEALALSLGNRGVLFATMRDMNDQNYGQDVIFRVFPHDTDYDPDAMVRYYTNLSGARTELLPNDYPTLLFFKDRNDPKSGQQVLVMHADDLRNPVYYIRQDRFEDFFGPGVSLHSISIEATKEPVTEGSLDYFLPVWKDVHLDFAEPANFRQ
jgi:hypothetical protein